MSVTHIKDLKPDPKNARKHGLRNIGMIEKALGEVGAARSIVIDENNTILAGNATVEAAAIAGIENVQVVEADGETIIAVRRTGLTKAQKAKLALYDNRTAEVAEGWDSDILKDLRDQDFDFDGLFNANELARLTGDLELLEDAAALWDGPDMGGEPLADRQLTIYFKDAGDVAAFATLLEQSISDKTKSLWYPARKP